MDADRRTAGGAELISVGSELLVGETVDTNAAFLARELALLGIPPQSARMVPDDRLQIAEAFREAVGRSAVVVATGGLGPTHDDLTREGLADALDEELVEDPKLLAALEDRFQGVVPMPAVNRKQATLVPSAEALANPIGSAPGWWVEHGDSLVALLPGVPSEMRRMWTEQVRPRLVARFPERRLEVATVKSFGLGESAIAERLRALLEAPGEAIEAGIYARDDGVHIRFSTRGPADALRPLVAAVLEALGADAYGTDHQTLPSAALSRLQELGAKTLASVESGTEGALLAVLASEASGEAAARYMGGVLQIGEPGAELDADTVLRLNLLPQDANGRSRVRVELEGSVTMQPVELRIHGSGPQRLRRAAFAALDAIRRL